MAYTSYPYMQLALSMLAGTNFTMAAMPYLMLFDNTYVPDVENHTELSNLPAGELVDPNYTTGGLEIDITGYDYDSVNKLMKLTTSGTVTFTAITAPARYAIVWDSNFGTLMGYIDLGADTTGDIEFEFPDGLIALQLA